LPIVLNIPQNLLHYPSIYCFLSIFRTDVDSVASHFGFSGRSTKEIVMN